ncbi:hypothetical protein EDI_254630 [Entamoeba dispar SAW760]|uniref:PI3K/PI4K catalytic domain-containing protein n=1 Tax=Entamoeba dispar (strain ATCC PRA-260 / SAW760) TaxID=370354 RepID=B0E8S1_ENTDS|nr:uncharacterized protein EDI_254630 [Entamoeba dispar SAW760]EDR29080.1 hypothetical protein EDI_254630 [Entamoeba dispar SAW760]|eukprot:EDR29080.1 hypothetical protein EDI_254630 [Entamoeba dispar SAW760]
MEKQSESQSNEFDLYHFLFEISMDSLEPKEVSQLYKFSEELFIKYLPLTLSYTSSQDRGKYKFELFRTLVKIGSISMKVLLRIMILHHNKNYCFCKSHDFLQYITYETSQEEKEEMFLKEFECNLVNMIIWNKNNYNEMKVIEEELNYQLNWIDKMYYEKECEGSTLLLTNKLEEIRNITNEIEIKEQEMIQYKWNLLINPYFGEGELKGIRVIKKYSTTCAPIEFGLIIKLNNKIKIKRVLYKKGDDLRVDLSAELSFHVFNCIWNKFIFKASPHIVNNEIIKPFAETYDVIPFNEGGLIEMVGCSNESSLCLTHTQLSCCIDGRIFELYSSIPCNKCHQILEVSSWDLNDKMKLIASLSGGFVAGFVVGLRDRHLENMKFHLCTHRFVHIDFGYILNKKPYFDANRFAIPTVIRNELQKTKVIIDNEIMNGWDAFISLSTIGYLMLRRNIGFLTRIISLLFSFDENFTDEAITQCLSHSFYLTLSEATAVNTLIGHLQVFSIQKMIKDSQHEILRWCRGLN